MGRAFTYPSDRDRSSVFAVGMLQGIPKKKLRSGVAAAKAASGCSSVMLARAAIWNPSVFAMVQGPSDADDSTVLAPESLAGAAEYLISN